MVQFAPVPFGSFLITFSLHFLQLFIYIPYILLFIREAVACAVAVRVVGGAGVEEDYAEAVARRRLAMERCTRGAGVVRGVALRTISRNGTIFFVVLPRGGVVQGTAGPGWAFLGGFRAPPSGNSSCFCLCVLLVGIDFYFRLCQVNKYSFLSVGFPVDPEGAAFLSSGV